MTGALFVTTRRLTKLLFVVSLFLFASLFHFVANASATTLHPTPNPAIPASVQNYLETCDSIVPLQTPAFAQWISAPGNPKDTSVSVTAGATSVALQYNFAGAYCADNSRSLGTSAKVTAASPGVSGIVGETSSLQFPGPSSTAQGAYDYASNGFTFAPSGGFKPGTNTYTVSLYFKKINHFSNGDYICVNSSGPGQDAHGGYNYDNCTQYEAVFTISVTAPTPTPTGTLTCATDSSNITLSLTWKDAYHNTYPGVHLVRTDNTGAVIYTGTTTASQGSTPVSDNRNPVQGTTYSYQLLARWDSTIVLATATGCKLKPLSGNDITCAPSTSSNQINFSWTGITTGNGVAVYRDGTTSTPPSSKLTATGAGQSSGSGSATDSNVSPGTSHTYNLVGNGTVLKSAFCTTPSVGIPPPPPPPPSTAFSVNGGASPTLDDDEAPTTLTSSGSFSQSPSTPTATGLQCSITVYKNGSPIASSPFAACSAGSSVAGPSPSPAGARAGDQFCATVTVSPGSGMLNPDGSVTSSGSYTSGTSSCPTVKNYPIFRVFNSSVTTGGTIGTCSATAGTLAGWFRTGANNYGSSAQLGAYAVANIGGFASNQTGSRPDVTNLSFANTTGIASSTTTDGRSPRLGGLVGGTCITALARPPARATALNGTVNITTLLNPASGPAYTFPSNTLIQNPAGATIDPDKRLAVFVTGDAYVEDDIVYTSTGWAIGTVPSFVLRASGNIYIGAGVTQLDGTYEADGTIYTCAQKLSASSFAPVPKNLLFASCNNQLTVRGSFVASNVKLMRTYGTMYDEISGVTGGCRNAGTQSSSRSCAGEVFEFDPAHYLEKPAAATAAAGATQYDAITSLPPVL